MSRAPNKRRSRLGQTLIEFTFVGIPMIFVLISIFEVSRGMWIYHTLAYSVKNGIRYASVHGINCVTVAGANPNTCSVNIGPANTAGSISYVIRQAAVGLDPAKTTLVFTDSSGTTTSCNLGNGSCPATVWPPNNGTNVNAVGQPIRIDIRTPFNSAIAMLWPGARAVRFTAGTLGASSQDYIQY